MLGYLGKLFLHSSLVYFIGLTQILPFTSICLVIKFLAPRVCLYNTCVAKKFNA